MTSSFSKTWARALAVGCFIASMAASRSGRADDAEKGALADALFQEAKSLMAAGKIHDACPKLNASYKLDRKLGTLLNLADCFEKDGKTSSAWMRFDEAVEWVKTQPDDRGDFALKRRDALTPVLAKIHLSVTRGAEKLDVFQDGVPIPEDALGLSKPVDPGPVDISVRRDDEVLEQRRVVATSGKDLEVPLDLAAISRAHPPKVAIAPVSRAQRTAGFVVGAVGLAGLATFGILEAAAYGQRAKANAQGGCRDGLCTPGGYRLDRKAGDLAEVGQWMGVGSAAVVAIGATLFLTAPRGAGAGDKSRVSLAPVVSNHGWGMAIGGSL